MPTGPSRPLDQSDDPLTDFKKMDIELEGVSKVVYCLGAGPAVIVMAEMPGITPHVARFSRWVSQAGFKIFLPSLFGSDGANPDSKLGRKVVERACISAEFSAFGGGQSSPITEWLRALARYAHEKCGGKGVGAIGMCFTGNFALSMMLEPAMIAPVLAQPSLPLDNPEGLEISSDELAEVKCRLEREDLKVLAFRFQGDSFCKAQRFAAYQKALGERFVGKVLPDSAANKVTPSFTHDLVKTPHSVFTAHLIDEEGQPTIKARDEVLNFFRQQLRNR